ncbi:cache domain-containing protein [Roseomonas gilardii]|uniref:cache domain-containing protein n=1 Tax=Roseomonas gilardii TaxID=257708 RepID=UPI000952CD05|nr:cache domain-containing protein [Roseomonas gilardii]
MALIGLEGWNAWADRSARLQQIETNATNLAQSLARQTSATINLADTVLVDLVERLETEGVNSPVRSRLDRLLAKHAAELPDRTNFFVYGEEGEWLASSLPSLPTGFNNADREYFQHHRASGERGAYLGAPVRSRSEGNWIIPVSRRFQHADGSFAGVVLATIDAEVLARSYAAFDIGQQGAIALFRADGALLARQPFDPSLIGRDLGNDGLFREQLPRAPLGAYQLVSPFDGVTRIAAFHRGERYPLVLTVAVAKHEALTAWRSEAIWRLLAASSLAGLLGLYWPCPTFTDTVTRLMPLFGMSLPSARG